MKWKAENNRKDLSHIVSTLINDSMSETEKTLSLLNWFDASANNFQNTWDKKVLFAMPPSYIFREKPYFCTRLIGHKNVLWTLTSRCGSCEEYALLFREMAKEANLTVRSINRMGEDHNWDEVLINNTWIIVEPPGGSIGFNRNMSDFDPARNISCLIAEYPNGTTVDVTSRYTATANITFVVNNTDGDIAKNVIIRMLSNNYQKNREANLNCSTGSDGKCMISLGDGNYTIVAMTRDFIPLSYQGDILIESNQGYIKNIYLKRNILKMNLIAFYYFVIIISPFLLWFCMAWLIEEKRMKKK